ncbi:MAG TPA: diguanylate cyclase [Actinobacteria bacterium]|nr:diguanylate cyclase [Actinomycetota bacterium]
MLEEGNNIKPDQAKNILGENETSGESLRRRYMSRFIIYSTLAILIVGAMLGWFLANSIRLELVEAYGHSTAAQVNAAVNSFLTRDDLKKPLKGKRYREFSKDMDVITTGTGVVEIKIWGRDGTIIFSEDRSQVGKTFSGNRHFRKALKGRFTAEFSNLSELHHKADRKKYAGLVEVYHPLHLTKNNRVDGVFEVYLSPALINKHIGRTLRSLAVAMGSLGFLLIIFAQVSSRMLRNRNDQLTKLTGELEKKTGDLQQSEARSRAISDTANDAILSIDLKGQITSWNPASEKIFGYSSSEVLGKNITILVPQHWRNAHEQAIARIAAGGASRLSGKTRELTALRKNGEEFPITLSLAESKAHDARIFIGMIRDITERKAREEKLKYLSTHDQLTDLYNHGTFFDFLEQEVERSKRHSQQFSLLMLDLDHFKKINDTFGHHVGDTVLSEVAARIKRACRTADIASRYGGEEFIVIMPETDLESALNGAERIRHEIAASAITRVGEQAVNITISIGVTTFPQDTSSEQKLIELADANLYAAKKSGRDRINWGGQAA